MRGIIVGDTFYSDPRYALARNAGCHRIATLLRKQGLTVEVLDFFNDWDLVDLKVFANSFDPDFFAVSSTLESLDIKMLSEYIQYLKQLNPNIKIIGGGTSLFNYIEGIDVFYKGNAEGAIEDIVKYLKTGYLNLTYLKTNEAGQTFVDCDKFYPEFDLERLRTTYIESDFIESHENLVLEFSRGCIFKCVFCNFAHIGKTDKDKYIRDKEDIKAEILENYQKYGVTHYTFSDDTFNDNVIKADMLYEISQELPFELRIMLYLRIDLLRAQNNIDKLYKAGIRGFFIGVESPSPEGGRAVRKGFSGEPLKNFIREIKNKYPDIVITWGFILGLPTDTYESVYDYIFSGVEENLIDHVHVTSLEIPINPKVSDLSEMSINWSSYGYEKMSDEELISEMSKYNTPYVKMLEKDFTQNENPASRNLLMWKQPLMNKVESLHHLYNIHQQIEKVTFVSGFLFWSFLHSGYSLEELMKVKDRNTVDWDRIKHSARSNVDSYIERKIGYYS